VVWLLDFHVPIDRVAEDLKSEFERLLKRHFLRNPPRDVRSVDQLSERQREVELRKAGSLDPSLAATGFTQQPDEILKVLLESSSGSGERSQMLKPLERLISPFASETGQKVLADFLSGLEPYFATTGMFGHPEWIEGSGLESLDAVSANDLSKARRLYQFGLSMADSASRGSEFLPSDIPPAFGEAASKTVRTLRDSDEWCVAGLAACAIAAHRARTGAAHTK
jgi:hypothetical protein